jgi:hypothetical protein
MTKSLYGGVQAHPLADCFPLIEGEAFEELKWSIQEHGLIYPITMFEGKILDGRNRKRACQELGLSCKEVAYTGDDPEGFVWDANAVRRQLTTGQLAIAAAKLATATSGRRPKDGSGDAVQTNSQVAERTGVSTASIKRGKRVLSEGAPALIEAVEKGQIAISPADRLAAKPIEEQTEILANTPIEDVPALVPDPRKNHDGLKIVPEFSDDPIKKGPGRGNVGPKVKMTEHLKRSSSVGQQTVTELWVKNKDLIPELDQALVAEFVTDLKTTRKFITQLLNLIERADKPGKEDS